MEVDKGAKTKKRKREVIADDESEGDDGWVAGEDESPDEDFEGDE